MGVSSFLLILLCFLAFSGSQTVQENTEVRVLMEIKSALDPDNKYLSSWSSGGDPCTGTFQGVACNEHHKVANISLQAKGLTGRISPAVAGLMCLSGLYLQYNSLTGLIPKEIANLTELSDLYLDENNLSGIIPSEIGNMTSLQVLQLCGNKLNGSIPKEIGSLKKLSVLAFKGNSLSGQIPSSLANLGMLRSIDLSFNQLIGPIPLSLSSIPKLEALNIRNNTLSGVVPAGLRKLNGGFQYENNPGLCGVGFPSLRACTSWDDQAIQIANNTGPRTDPISANIPMRCNKTHCTHSSKLLEVGIATGIITTVVILAIAGFLTIYRYRRRQQKIGTTCDTSEDPLSVDQAGEVYRSPSPLVTLEYSKRWDIVVDDQTCSGACPEFLQGLRFNLEEVESATQHFSDFNLLGKSNSSAVYRGILKDGSAVAIKRINKTSCKSDEAEFMKGLSLLTSLKHGNLVRLEGFCCSKSRGECFLIYAFAPRGNLSQYLDVDDGSDRVLDWHKRVAIINGIAKGIGYLHLNETNKPGIVHQNISVEKVVIDQQFNPLILDCGLLKLLADDAVFSALKVSAAFGYMAPEYITTGRFTEKSDVYAFGMIILQIVSGKRKLASSVRQAAESCKIEDFIDANLKGMFSESEAAKLAKIATLCTNENPEHRPTMEAVIQELIKPNDSCE